MKKRLLISCSGGEHLGRSIANRINASYSRIKSERFPDSELRIKIPDVRGKEVYFIQSFYRTKDNDINDKLVELLFAAKTARELKAKKIFLIAPYLAYLREDKRFKKGESVNAKIISKLFAFFDKVYVVEPHLHRFKKFNEFFPNAVRIKLEKEISRYIQKKIKKDFLLVGPDKESEQWVGPVAKSLKTNHTILNKKRFHARKVQVKGKRISQDTAIIIDDIISTGQTLIEASKLIKAKKIYFIGIHGIFSENALKKLRKIGEVVVSNTIPSPFSKIDCSDAIARMIK